MKITKKNAKRIAAVLLGFVTLSATAASFNEPVNANASIHLDWWNDYEDNCRVVYEQVNEYSYKVIVISGDNHRIWRNDVDTVMYWYSKQNLGNMIGAIPWYMGTVTCDIRAELLNNPTYFARFSG